MSESVHFVRPVDEVYIYRVKLRVCFAKVGELNFLRKDCTLIHLQYIKLVWADVVPKSRKGQVLTDQTKLSITLTYC